MSLIITRIRGAVEPSLFLIFGWKIHWRVRLALWIGSGGVYGWYFYSIMLIL